MFEIIEAGNDQYGKFEIAKNNLTGKMYKRITFIQRKKEKWTGWYQV